MVRPGLRTQVHNDVWAGALFIAFGLLGLWLSRGYNMGSLQYMSTGYFPRLVCYGLIMLGAAVAWLGFRKGEEEGGETIPLTRAVVIIPVAVAVFGWTVERFGLVVALVAMLSLGALAGRGLKPLSFAIAVISLVAVCYLIFIWGLRMPMDLWPRG